MSRKAQVTVITIFFIVLMFFIVWAFFLADFISMAGQEAISRNNLTGFEAFFYSNLNFLILIVLIIFTFAALHFAGGGK